MEMPLGALQFEVRGQDFDTWISDRCIFGKHRPIG